VGTAFKFLINGVLVATISTTMPAASDLYGTGVIVDNKNTATAVGVTLFHSTLMLKIARHKSALLQVGVVLF